MKALYNLINISKYAGQRFDLIQAGGGNSSVKLDDGTMLIKASGYLLSDIEIDRGYAKVDNKAILEILSSSDVIYAESKKSKELAASSLVKEATLNDGARPSIETFLHALLLKYTLHTHPLVVNIITCRTDWKENLISFFGEEILLVKYCTPGIELAEELACEINKYKAQFNNQVPNIIFLQNHGLIVTSDMVEDIEKLTERVLTRIEESLGIDNECYRDSNRISNLYNEMFNSSQACSEIAYRSNDADLKNIVMNNSYLLNSTPFCPDGLVFCGVTSLELSDLSAIAIKQLKDYFNKYQEKPKVIIYKKTLFFMAANVKKAKEIEEVYRFHLMVLKGSGENVEYLPNQELKYLGQWEAEKYRQKI